MKKFWAILILLILFTLPFYLYFIDGSGKSKSEECVEKCFPRLGNLIPNPAWIKPDNRKPVPKVCSCQ